MRHRSLALAIVGGRALILAIGMRSLLSNTLLLGQSIGFGIDWQIVAW
jgi:hypothetical protein